MEDFIRKIVKEELAKALVEIAEPSYPVSKVEDNEQIIYNFDAGRSFGVNKLSKDIIGLQEYFMSSYFPHSEMSESWSYEINTNYGGSQLIEIIHEIKEDYNSYWKLNIAQVDKGSNEPQITNSTGFIRGYDSFIKTVNSKLEKSINPGFL